MRRTDYDIDAHRGDCPYGQYLSAYSLDEIVEAIHSTFAWEEACRTGKDPDPASIDFEIDRIVDEDGKDLTEEARRIQERMKAEGWKYYNKGTSRPRLREGGAAVHQRADLKVSAMKMDFG